MATPPPASARRLLPLSLGLFQGALLLFFALFVTYDEPSAVATQAEDGTRASEQLPSIFPLFQDIQVMLAVGLGLLLAFLPRYGLSALAHNFLLLNFSTQWALLLQGARHRYLRGELLLGLPHVLAAEFAAVTVLISVGAVLGRTSPCQLLAVAFCEVPVYLASEWLIVTQLGVRDVGGTITIHVFACYFGLGVSKALFGTERQPAHPKETPTPRSDLLALVGTLTLWVFWPSFVAAPCQPGDAQHRAILNTLLALSASAVTTVVASSLLESGGKLSPSHLHNGSLAGGVAIGALADVPVTPAASLALGSLSSLVCLLGFRFLTPLLARRLALHDQCGIHNLHGLPGILGAVASAVAVLAVSEDTNRCQLSHVDGSGVVGEPGGCGGGRQALWQVAGLAVALGGSMISGMLTGAVLRLPCLAPPPEPLCFEDSLNFRIQEQAESTGMGDTTEEMALKERV
ncbi:ammonium transporter Rh type B-like [Oxyura jamaicensis]|uniref:ammonium transporter Rh type B-like n=1 Tax=Oxyura jamaicensis TaxID=8884 RepID=UPI0015A59219|nr:ammonium transporter Rh type B-like [Oxyura jamaicensis]